MPAPSFAAGAAVSAGAPAAPLKPSAAVRPTGPFQAAVPDSSSAAETGPLTQLELERFPPAVRQYLLVCHARSISITQGQWCFSLESISGEPILDVECEEEGDLNRLSLLAAVRGLESIDGRGAVSLISNNRYLIRSLDRSLPRWRENDFVWEQFGRKMPVQNADLWRRIDRTLGIHCVTASLLQSTRVSTGSLDPRTPFGSALVPAETAELPHSVLRFDRPHAAAGEGPSDGLRRWLAGNCDAAPIVTRRGRYRAADLAGG
ncbi:MAG: ribonuclease HI [Planctomycetaceae bacterium]